MYVFIKKYVINMFHDNYDNAVLASWATFYVALWAYTVTQIEIECNLSPIGRVTPKEWKD